MRISIDVYSTFNLQGFVLGFQSGAQRNYCFLPNPPFGVQSFVALMILAIWFESPLGPTGLLQM